MQPDSLWQKELLEETKGKRSLLFKFILPLLLLAPFTLPQVPLQVRVAGLTIAVLFIGVFGSSVRLSRIRESKMLERLGVLPLSPRRLTAEYLFASAIMDALQLALPFVLVVATLPENALSLVEIAPCFGA
ncbi:MAG TPA: hypothetical protein VE134_03645, partial [Methanomicrobiales archaeon]|nr:hypothetical protein [Methanomicrobiales archaeon]